ncbi:stage II sporulation protein M [Bacillus carboniphilus]|uniref:Stage II sporulation protein M n=1 Tax=Bacillus carboniphilus TaxID=86663 RepID=A0ABY9JWP6_9BACI|nr:stage II sporulation protein M [Bacillus carboniphilus]WLR43811.1 stage II sporulation protein M [Bacillus carboniphilus]
MTSQSLKVSVSEHLREKASIYLFVFVLLIMGVIFGAIIVNSMSISSREDLFSYLERFFGQIQSGQTAQGADLFKQSFIDNIKFIGLIWLLGISIIGLPIILIMLFLKGIVVGFTVGFLVNQMGWNGFLLSFVAVFPQNLLLIPLFLVTSVLAISFSLNVLKQLFTKNYRASPSKMFFQYVVFMFIISIFVLIPASFEAYISPLLMEKVVSWF